ncbi:Gaa1-like protein [Radiomyces spectabilis]|uniref:Gaa1-like protein n=1 Tax=Radiomyces spectabilis TaxID=64574 RepID=UPI002220B4A4|nr:Gaa1-like protein [Radiomyces spectabilis]KAI8391330.1 Gaa1-like protein [Radiomyces spectabilis]
MLLSKIRARLAAKRGASRLSIEKRRKIGRILVKYVPILSILLLLTGVIWILLLPYEGYNKRTYISENALLPGQVNVHYNYDDVRAAEQYRSLLEDVQSKDSETRAKFIQSELRHAGFSSVVQQFDTEQTKGVNAFAIYRAPRSDGKEALVLSAPWMSRTGDYNTNGIAALLSIAKLFKRNVFWSKDIIFLVTDQGMTGTQAWLDAYHGIDQADNAMSSSSVVMPRSGAIQGVLNLDFPGTNDYETLGVFFEGVNGQLPNLDLVNTLMVIAKSTARIPVTLHDDTFHHAENQPFGHYLDSLRHMFSTIQYQALGHPSSDAGLYLRYKIDAVTIHGILGTTNLHSLFGFHRIGVLVESTFRSLNNLLEHFHQSFFFYLLPQPDRYVSIGVYMPPIILFACSLIFLSLVLYYIDLDTLEKPPVEQDKHQFPPAYSLQKRDIGPAFSVLVPSHLGGLAIFYVMQSNIGYDAQGRLVQFSMAGAVALFTSIACSTWISHRKVSGNASRILKSLCLAESALVISSVSLLNFGLALITAITIVIPYIFVRPTRYWGLRIFQWVLLTTISPAGLGVLYSTVLGGSLTEALLVIQLDYQIVSSWLLTFICVVYWPINIAMHALVFATS